MFTLLGFIIFFVLVLFIPVGASIFVENTNIIIKLVIFRVIKIRIFDKTKVKKSKRVTKKVWRKIPFEILLEIGRKMLPHIRHLMLKMHIEINLRIEYGFASPDKTALVYGAVSALLHSIDNILRYQSKRYCGSYRIEPDLNNQLLEIKFVSKLHTSLVNYIIFGFHALKILLKYKSYFKREGGALNDRSCNRGAYENYNG